MAIPSESLAVISTGHLPEEEAKALTEGAAVALGGMQREFGWMLSTRLPPDNDALPVLAFVLGYLRGKGFDWVLFDADAAASDELQTYDW